MIRIGITLGDPAGIGPEVVDKALSQVHVPARLFGRVSGPVRYGEICAEYGRVALEAIHAAIDAVMRGECSALVTAPIHKEALAAEGKI